MTAALEKGHKGIGMEGPLARWYEKTTRNAMDEFRRIAGRIRSLAPANAAVLEVAPGPGFLAIELARGGRLQVTGLDISKTFVQLARNNAAAAGVNVDFRHGNASRMPFPDEQFDLIVCRAAFKNFTDPEGALREMKRVLRPGGRGMIFDLRRDVSMAEVKRHVDALNLRPFSRWFTLLTFQFMLLKRAYTKEAMERMVQAAGFSQAGVDTGDIGLEAWFRK
ncbi:MAG TPA: methyltransferase domain-containing protein [Bryobacteraceae bacterium]|nr:methyltransferase domain-containing protein [Bryobacteraceae bacterium]